MASDSNPKWKRLSKTANGFTGLSGRTLSRERSSGGGGAKKNKRATWAAGFPILKQGSYVSLRTQCPVRLGSWLIGEPTWTP